MTLNEYKKNFIKKHSKADWKVDTSSMDQHGTYTKTYSFSDGAQMIEVNGPCYEEVEFEVKGVKFKQTVKLFRTEIWNTDDPKSVYFYEKF